MNIERFTRDLLLVLDDKNATLTEKKHAIYFFGHQIADMQKEACELHFGNPMDSDNVCDIYY